MRGGKKRLAKMVHPELAALALEEARELLLQAADDGDVELIERALGSGIDPSTPLFEGRTALHRAAAFGHVDAIDCLLDHGCKLGGRDEGGNCAMATAVRCGQPKAMAALLAKHGRRRDAMVAQATWAACDHGQAECLALLEGHPRAALGQRTEDGRSLLMAAASSGDPRTFEMALAWGALDPREVDDDGMNAFHHACASGSVECMEIAAALCDVRAKAAQETTSTLMAVISGEPAALRWLSRRGLFGLDADDMGRGPILMAASCGAAEGVVEVLECLRAMGGPIDAVDAQGFTALRVAAAKEGAAHVVERLLEWGLDPDQKDGKGRTPLLAACGNKAADYVELLAKASKPGARDRDGNSALHLAARACFPEAFKWVADSVSAGMRDQCGRTPLLWAAATQDGAESVAGLVEWGFLEARSPEGDTALILAARDGHADSVAVLIEAGADPLAKNKKGVDALMAAGGGGHLACVELLARKSDVGRLDLRGVSALALACAGDRTECARVLLATGKVAKMARVPDEEGRTPLHRACAYVEGGFPSGLLAASCLDALDADGRPALMVAAFAGARAKVEALMEAGADLNLRDELGSTALMRSIWGRAAGEEDPDALAMLLAPGSELEAVDDMGRSAAEVARLKGRSDLAAWLRGLAVSKADRAALVSDGDLKSGARTASMRI